MSSIAFIDTEIDPVSHRILDIGCVRSNGGTYHSASISDFSVFIKGTEYICGHNIINHDLIYIRDAIKYAGISEEDCIDTLHLSPLLFPKRPYHALVKDCKQKN